MAYTPRGQVPPSLLGGLFGGMPQQNIQQSNPEIDQFLQMLLSGQLGGAPAMVPDAAPFSQGVQFPAYSVPGMDFNARDQYLDAAGMSPAIKGMYNQEGGQEKALGMLEQKRMQESREQAATAVQSIESSGEVNEEAVRANARMAEQELARLEQRKKMEMENTVRAQQEAQQWADTLGKLGKGWPEGTKAPMGTDMKPQINPFTPEELLVEKDKAFQRSYTQLQAAAEKIYAYQAPRPTGPGASVGVTPSVDAQGRTVYGNPSRSVKSPYEGAQQTLPGISNPFSQPSAPAAPAPAPAPKQQSKQPAKSGTMTPGSLSPNFKKAFEIPADVQNMRQLEDLAKMWLSQGKNKKDIRDTIIQLAKINSVKGTAREFSNSDLAYLDSILGF